MSRRAAHTGVRGTLGLVTLLGALLAPGCTASTGDVPVADGGIAKPSPAATPVKAAAVREEPLPGERDPALRAALVNSRQMAADASYRVGVDAAVPVATNAAHGFALRYEASRVAVAHAETADGEAWQTGLSLTGVGRGAARELPSVARVTVEGNRVEYRRSGLLESYVNGPLGVEQSFEVARAPEGEGTVTLAISVDGETEPVLAADGKSVDLEKRGGRPLAEISELFVHDAEGRTLASSFAVEGGKIELRYEDAGAHYPVVIDPLIATLRTTVRAAVPIDDGYFGDAVALVGNTAVIGGLGQGGTNTSPTRVGEANVYTRTSGTAPWTLQTSLAPASLPSQAQFGTSVALSPDGNTVAVGAPSESGGGVVYVFVRSGSTWVQQTRIQGVPTVSMGANFGSAVVLGNNLLVVGASQESTSTAQYAGGLYVFVRSGTTWSAPQVHLRGSTANSNIGIVGSIALYAGTLVYGDQMASAGGFAAAGKVYVYAETHPNSWVRQVILQAPVPKEGAFFGRSVALLGTTLAVGSTAYSGTVSGGGSVDVFTGSGNQWRPEAFLIPSGAHANSRYGMVALATDTLLVAANGGNTQPAPAYLFKRSGTTWTEESQIAEPAPNAFFGCSEALTTTDAIIGACEDTNNRGAAYLYNLSTVALSVNGTACTAASTCASGFCTDGVCCNTACDAGVTDCMACSTTQGGTTNGTCTALTATAAAAITCRASAGVCDVAEKCSPSSSVCPANGFLGNTTTCRAASGVCDAAETCTGTTASCPGDAMKPSTTVCRAAAGACDAAEMCTGTSNACPADGLLAIGTVCRPLAGTCDVAETCNGGITCPPDAFAPIFTTCRASINPFCDPAELCLGTTAQCGTDTNNCP
jgi:hypothetical protein